MTLWIKLGVFPSLMISKHKVSKCVTTNFWKQSYIFSTSVVLIYENITHSEGKTNKVTEETASFPTKATQMFSLSRFLISLALVHHAWQHSEKSLTGMKIPDGINLLLICLDLKHDLLHLKIYIGISKIIPLPPWMIHNWNQLFRAYLLSWRRFDHLM